MHLFPNSLFIAALAATLLPIAVFAQQPTPQQQSAIRASCRSDFQPIAPAFPRAAPKRCNA